MKNQKRQKQKEYFFYAIIAGVTSIYIEIIAIGTYMYEQECVVDFPEPEYWIFFAAISIAAFIAFILILRQLPTTTVKFRATEMISTAKTQAIEDKISKLRKQKMDFLSKNPFAEQKVALVSCKKCGSKISRVELVKQNRSTCPVCMADMTSKTHQDRVKAYDKKIVALEKELADTRKKLANKAEIFWIAKVEVHV